MLRLPFRRESVTNGRNAEGRDPMMRDSMHVVLRSIAASKQKAVASWLKNRSGSPTHIGLGIECDVTLPPPTTWKGLASRYHMVGIVGSYVAETLSGSLSYYLKSTHQKPAQSTNSLALTPHSKRHQHAGHPDCSI